MGIRERKARERENRRDVIRDAARTAFLEVGIQQCSMERIASTAEVAKGTLYLYYKNRDELILAILAEDFNKIVTKIEKIAARKLGADKKLHRCVDVFLQYTRENDVFYKELVRIGNEHSSAECCKADLPYMKEFAEIDSRIFTATLNIVQEGVDSGLFTVKTKIHQTVLDLMLATRGSMLLCQSSVLPPQYGKINCEQVVRNVTSLLIKGLMH